MIVIKKMVAILFCLALASCCTKKIPQAAANSINKTASKSEQSTIEKIIKKDIGNFKYCYEEYLRNNPQSIQAGKIITDFIVDKNGYVNQVKLTQDDFKNFALRQCLEYKISRLVFPKPGGGVVNIVYPFQFSISK